MTNNLTIYVTPTCVSCRAAKRKLDALGLPYSVVDVTEDAEAADRIKRNGFLQAPVFAFAGKFSAMDGLPAIIKALQAQKEASEA